MHADSIQRDPTYGITTSDPLALDEQIVYDVPHAAKVLDLSDRQVWHLIRSGAIESFKMEGSRRIERQALVNYIDDQKRKYAEAVRGAA